MPDKTTAADKTENQNSDQKVTELQNQLTTTSAQLQAAEAAKANLKEEVRTLKNSAKEKAEKAAGEIENVKSEAAKTVNSLTEQIGQLKEDLGKKDRAISKLMEQMKNAVNSKDESSVKINTEDKPAAIPAEPVTVDGEQYKFRKPYFTVPGVSGVHKAEEAIHDEELVRKVIAVAGQTVLEKVN